jgi:hypothetical protein
MVMIMMILIMLGWGSVESMNFDYVRLGKCWIKYDGYDYDDFDYVREGFGFRVFSEHCFTFHILDCFSAIERSCFKR